LCLNGLFVETLVTIICQECSPYPYSPSCISGLMAHSEDHSHSFPQPTIINGWEMAGNL